VEERRRGGVEEWRCGGVEEWRSGGVEELRSGGAVGWMSVGGRERGVEEQSVKEREGGGREQRRSGGGRYRKEQRVEERGRRFSCALGPLLGLGYLERFFAISIPSDPRTRLRKCRREIRV
jgi:hypothetical protein